MMVPPHCSFVSNGLNCNMPIEFVIEIINENGESFMVGLTCSDHRKQLEDRFMYLKKNNHLFEGKILLRKLKTIQTTCVKGNDEDVNDILFRRNKQ